MPSARRKPVFAGLFPPPALGTRLVLKLVGTAIGTLNLIFLAEIWPHTPAAQPVLGALEWLLLLALVPQGLWWTWQWLRAFTGPIWLRLLAKMAFMTGVCLVAAVWLLVLVGGTAAILSGF